MTATTSLPSKISAKNLRDIYIYVKQAVKSLPFNGRVDPRDVFCNNALNLKNITVYGFDYDYTLAVYTRAINKLIYDLSMEQLIRRYEYPKGLLSIPYDPRFAIRGLHYDIYNSCLLKVDAFSQIENGTVYRGRIKLTKDEIIRIYNSFSLSEIKEKSLMQLSDLFSLPWAGLLSTLVQYFDDNGIVFDPICTFHDVKESVRYVHEGGGMHNAIVSNLEQYIHKNLGLKEYLETLCSSGKKLFIVTNSPFSFMNRGMCYMLGEDWRKYFQYIVVMAKKPEFFQGHAPFRRYYEDSGNLSYEKVTSLQPGKVYAGGHIAELSKQAMFRNRQVLYFGDHIYTDLADPMLMLGWHTAAIVPELAREIRSQNDENYQRAVAWIEYLTMLIQKFYEYSETDVEIKTVIGEWLAERTEIRQRIKHVFNPQFGSIFRTYSNMTVFSRQLSRLADIYTSRLPNMLKYKQNHQFFPRRYALPHEPLNAPLQSLSDICSEWKKGTS
uniref:5'-nucleotidase domain-containing protein 3 n=1 Tax=Syphacia muris TaxID=451379 RepID=A0A0N5AAG9_9BILA